MGSDNRERWSKNREGESAGSKRMASVEEHKRCAEVLRARQTIIDGL